MERPTLRQLEYAVALADEGHFGRAAERVAVSQPGLSDQIQSLEQRLGAVLFERSRRGAQLTSAGLDVVSRARRVLAAVDELVLAAGSANGVSGRLRVAVIPTMAPYVLPRVAQRSRRLWPEADLELIEEQTSSILEGLRAGDIDLGVIALPYDVGSLVTDVFDHEAFFLAIPAGHPLDEDGAVPLHELQDVPLLLLEDGHCLRDHALAVCEVAGKVAHEEVRSASLSTLAQMVACGEGATLLPAGAVAIECRRGSGVKARQLADPAPGRDLALAWRPTDPRGDAFAELAAALRT